MDKNDVINKLIPADDLHWSDSDGFTMVSIEEVEKIIQVGYDNDMDEDEILKMLRWSENVRAGQLLYKNVMSGGLRMSFDGDEPIFARNNNA